jgi:hypothetical protein
MVNSSFDMEIYARTFRENVHREAEKARRVEEARSRGQVHRADPGQHVARLLTAARSWLSARRSGPAAKPGHMEAELPRAALIVDAEVVRSAPRPQLSPAAQPYAGMVVIARGTTLQPLEEPSAVRDC